MTNLSSLMTKKIKESTKDVESEYTVRGVKSKKVINKGTWCMTMKVLYRQNLSKNVYHIPLRAYDIKVPLSEIYFPGEKSDLTRENYLVCETRSEVKDDNQIKVIYVINSNSIEELRNYL